MGNSCPERGTLTSLERQGILARVVVGWAIDEHPEYGDGPVTRLPKVALLLETSTHYARGLLRGVIRYSHLHGPWSLYIGAGDLEQGLPKIEFDAIIARAHSARLAHDIKRMSLPTVIVECGTEELAKENPLCRCSEIRTDSVKIANLVADHLMDQDFQSFGFCGFVNAPWSRARENAFARYLEEKGFPCVKHTINISNWMRYADWTRAWPCERRRLVALLKSLPRPTGLMACNDMCGRQVLEACADAGVRVPADVAVVGVDNDELMCELCDPPLSSVALDVEGAGYEAALLLDGLMSGTIKKRKQVVPVNPRSVIARRSSDLIVKNDRLVGDALRFIKDHVGRSVGVPDVVSEMGVSRRTLERRFSRTIGRSILSEINRCRLDRAKCLLQETALPVSSIASEAGFANIGMLNRIFRRAEGVPPRAFRLRSQKVVATHQQATEGHVKGV
jgi:LacI family transcriptional regulator